ncbi:MAG: hypothetical protein AB7F53_08695 [Nitrososphaeraceae archaeon]
MQNEMNLTNTNINANNQSISQDHLNELKKLYSESIKKEIAERNERVANEISSSIDEVSNTIGIENNQEISSLVKTFNDIIEEAISVRIEPDAMTNSTIQALYFSNLIDSIDLSYATALDTKPMNMSSMSMNMRDNNNMTNMNKDTDNTSNNTSTITNIASFQTAKELTNDAIDLFNSTVKQNIPSNATDNSNTIESGLQQLKDMIELKASYDNIIGVIHGIIHTNTQEAFNLPLKTSN